MIRLRRRDDQRQDQRRDELDGFRGLALGVVLGLATWIILAGLVYLIVWGVTR